MTNDNEPDPALMSLARLPSLHPRHERVARTRMRCHAVLARQEALARTSARAPLARAADVALAAVLFGYATIALFEVIRLMRLPM